MPFLMHNRGYRTRAAKVPPFFAQPPHLARRGRCRLELLALWRPHLPLQLLQLLAQHVQGLRQVQRLHQALLVLEAQFCAERQRPLRRGGRLQSGKRRRRGLAWLSGWPVHASGSAAASSSPRLCFLLRTPSCAAASSGSAACLSECAAGALQTAACRAAVCTRAVKPQSLVDTNALLLIKRLAC